jgi:hypothetical protein
VAGDVTERLDAPARSKRAGGDVARYVLAVLGYIALGTQTKGYLSFAWGLTYFVLVLDVLPRLYRWIRDRRIASTNAADES